MCVRVCVCRINNDHEKYLRSSAPCVAWYFCCNGVRTFLATCITILTAFARCRYPCVSSYYNLIQCIRRSIAGKFSNKKQVKQAHFFCHIIGIILKQFPFQRLTTIILLDLYGGLCRLEPRLKSLSNSDSWGEGRIIVNIAVVVNGLKEGCGRCHQLLQLTDCVGESLI